jgi:hypothetical protein
MNSWGISRRALGLGVLIAAVAGGSAHAATTPNTSACNPPSYALTQPFLSLNDSNWYTLAPGQAVDSFNGAGWMLLAGARIIATTLADGSTGAVLYLPPGSTAISPPMCVDSEFSTARVTLLQKSVGPGIRVYDAYTGDTGGLRSSGVVDGEASWSVSPQIQLAASELSGWQYAQYTFTAPLNGGNVELYDFYVDPRCHV